jgi:hypothetical protein
VHHLFMLGLIEPSFATRPSLGELLQDAQVQCAAVTVAGRFKHGSIVLASFVEHRLNCLRAVVIAKQEHPLDDIFEALANGSVQLATQ